MVTVGSPFLAGFGRMLSEAVGLCKLYWPSKYSALGLVPRFIWSGLDCGLPLWGARGRVFESLRPDHIIQ